MRGARSCYFCRHHSHVACPHRIPRVGAWPCRPAAEPAAGALPVSMTREPGKNATAISLVNVSPQLTGNVFDAPDSADQRAGSNAAYGSRAYPNAQTNVLWYREQARWGGVFLHFSKGPSPKTVYCADFCFVGIFGEGFFSLGISGLSEWRSSTSCRHEPSN